MLFASQPLIKTIYFAIPLILLYVWSFSRFIKAISGKTIFSTIDVGGMEINSYLWFSSLLFMMLSLTIYAGIYFSWNKLEIREKGLWVASETVWEKITDYSWEQNKDSDILRIEQINDFQKKIETKYKIYSGNKEKIDKILRDKLKK